MSTFHHHEVKYIKLSLCLPFDVLVLSDWNSTKPRFLASTMYQIQPIQNMWTKLKFVKIKRHVKPKVVKFWPSCIFFVILVKSCTLKFLLNEQSILSTHNSTFFEKSFKWAGWVRQAGGRNSSKCRASMPKIWKIMFFYLIEKQ